ncbi:MAG: hypothetical protein SOU07_07405 [Bacilli bacterium]|nr:hypothetical protein [Acholeplasmataceae bacterium]MDY2903247.1 hypothetical protein [Bacilli bacterium]
MKKLIKNRTINKVILTLLVCFTFITITNVNAGTGYTYDSKGNPIYSTEGFTVNSQPLNYADLGIVSETFEPSDLFVYTPEVGERRIYLTDSKLNKVFVFDNDLVMLGSFGGAIFNPSELHNTTLTEIKTYDQPNNRSKKIYQTEKDVENVDTEINFYNVASIYRAVTPATGLDLIYICDKGNSQVVILDATTYDPTTEKYRVYQVVTKPYDELGDSVAFSPKKVITDIKGRMYIIAENVTDGIMQFSVQGEFDRYTGTNDITLTAWQIFWRNFSTEAQLSTQKTLYNTTFNSMAYSNTMIYTVSNAIINSDDTKNTKIMIKKINPSGDDILRRNGYKEPMGDVKYSEAKDLSSSDTGPSQLVGITVNDYGVYSVIDNKRGRIFTYDNEGNLLYISGGTGDQADKLSNPIAIQYLDEDLLVLDRRKGTIVRYEPTEIATIINQAVYQEYIGRTSRQGIKPVFNISTQTWWIDKEDTKLPNKDAKTEVVDGYWYIGGVNTNIKEEELAASDYWEQVVKLNANYEYAYVGIGHKYMNDKNYKEAMHYFELGENREYYSKAFKQYRDAIIKKWFGPVVVTIAVLAIGKTVYKIVRNKKLGIKKQEETGVGDE